jgi:hypothetical protein
VGHRLAIFAIVFVLGRAGGAEAQDTDQVRFYVGARSRIAFQLKGEAAPGVEVSSGQQLNGFYVGVNL